MRELKFKAWDKKLKQWCSEESFNIIGEWTIFDCLNRYIDGDFINRLNDIEIVQYTGLKDKNDIEIYEGDIVEYIQLEHFRDEDIFKKIDAKIHIGVIEWVNYSGCMGFVYRGKDKRVYIKLNSNLIYNHKIKIIGNIYENSELLKDKKC